MNKRFITILISIVLLIKNVYPCYALRPIAMANRYSRKGNTTSIQGRKTWHNINTKPYNIDEAIKEGRLFVIKDLENQNINIIYSGSPQEVTNYFCQFLGDISKSAKDNLKRNLRSKKLREDLWAAFHAIIRYRITKKAFPNQRFGIILEKRGEPTFGIGPKRKTTGKKATLEEIFYCDLTGKYVRENKTPLVCLGLNMMRERFLNTDAFSLSLEHKARDADRDKHLDPREEIQQGLLTEDMFELIDEFCDEISGKKYNDVLIRSQELRLKETLSADQVERILLRVFDLTKSSYAFTGVSHDRFYPSGIIYIKESKYPYFSMQFREYFYRAGNIFVVDSNYRKCLPKGLFNTNAKIIFVDFRKETVLLQKSTHTKSDYRFGTIGILLALQTMDLRGKIVVDAGAGNGILGIAAALLGAKKVILLEGAKEYKKVAMANAKDNGVLDKFDFQYFGYTFQDLYKEARESHQAINGDIILANIPFGGLLYEDEFGYHGENLIRMLLYVFNCPIYIASGSDYGYLGARGYKMYELFNNMGLVVKDIIELSNFGIPKPTITLININATMELRRKFLKTSGGIEQKPPRVYRETSIPYKIPVNELGILRAFEAAA